MKTSRFWGCPLIMLALALPALAATLPNDTPLYQAPTTISPVIATLKAGTEVEPFQPVKVGGDKAPLPAGWVVISYEGPFQAYVPNQHVSKDLSVRPDAKLYAAPKEDAPVFGAMQKGGKSNYLDTTGDWSKFLVQTPVTGYLLASALGEPKAQPPAPATAGPVQASAPPPPAPAASAPQPTAAAPANAAEMPHLFQGYLRRTRHFMGMGPTYHYELVNADGQRLMLLDLSTLLPTDPIDFFVGKKINVFGVGNVPSGGKDLVLKVQSLSLASQ